MIPQASSASGQSKRKGLSEAGGSENAGCVTEPRNKLSSWSMDIQTGSCGRGGQSRHCPRGGRQQSGNRNAGRRSRQQNRSRFQDTTGVRERGMHSRVARKLARPIGLHVKRAGKDLGQTGLPKALAGCLARSASGAVRNTNAERAHGIEERSATTRSVSRWTRGSLSGA